MKSVASQLQTKNHILSKGSPITIDGDEQISSCSADGSGENGCEHVQDFPTSSESCNGHGPGELQQLQCDRAYSASAFQNIDNVLPEKDSGTREETV